MESIDRRTAVNAMLGMGALAVLPHGRAFASEASVEADSASSAAADSASEATAAVDIDELTPQPVNAEAEMGQTTLTLDELNDLRHQFVDAAGEFTREDGSVVSEPYAKLRALLNTYSVGTGNGAEDSIDYIMMLFTEEDAEHYLEMPYGRIFSAADYAEQSGREEDECTEICDDLAMRGLLYRVVRSGRALYHHIPIVLGNFEYSVNDFFEPDWTPTFLSSWLAPVMEGNVLLRAGSPIEYAIPCDESVVADDQILALDDYTKIVERYDTIVVIPCQCRTLFMAASGVTEQFPEDELKDAMSPVCGHPVETCMAFGEEAEFALWSGRGRQIDKDEALSILKRSVDAGMILQNMYTKNSEFICSCHGDCCGVLSSYIAVGPEVAEKSVAYKFTSNYTLEYDRDACIQCGSCVERCPMFAISMDETNHPTVNALCMRCGQCGLVCPVGARKLVAKPEEERGDRPDDLLGDANLEAAWRFENGDLTV
jgi:ferredoxin